MPQIIWTDDLSVGLASVDDQHKQLFAIANDLLEAVESGKGEAVLKETFDHLKAYAEFHFKEEEAFMKEVGYPGISAHTAEHALLLMRVNTLWRLIQKGENISPKGVSLFVTEWITDHIMDKDNMIGEFVRS